MFENHFVDGWRILESTKLFFLASDVVKSFPVTIICHEHGKKCKMEGFHVDPDERKEPEKNRKKISIMWSKLHT